MDKCNNLGGFPPIYKINEQYKKKREFGKTPIKINSEILLDMNILKIKNIQ